MKFKLRNIGLVIYDLIIFTVIAILILRFYHGGGGILYGKDLIHHIALALFCFFGSRVIFKIYKQIWRYGGIQCYIRLMIADLVGGLLYFISSRMLNLVMISFARVVAMCAMSLLCSLGIRMVYRYAYKCGSQPSRMGSLLRFILRVFSFGRVNTEADPDSQRIKIAIIGAGSVGVGLAEDLLNNPRANCIPRCFVDSDPDKVGREIHGLDVLQESEPTIDILRSHHIQEVVFAIPALSNERKMELVSKYKSAGFRIKIYDYPAFGAPGKKRQLREFSVDDLLMRQERETVDEATASYYRDKTILITGGGGSIGSELCRQLAKMHPAKIVVLDINENTAYELQQDILFAYHREVDIRVEIVSITNRAGLRRVFENYHPDIVINAAAHKHVPLMEHNCIEAVENNVFGTWNVLMLCEEFRVQRFMMVSTDKAVNPTNVMGATKRLCELITLAFGARGIVKCSATRFGNVLGSAGSVIPLFKRQIAAGGPITLTDKRIIRYFMTIPEASQLVLTSGAMAQNGEIFVLDMGKPVKILDLAESMIQLSGVDNIEIKEIGLRPGEKLYEELLVQKDSLEKTSNNLIFIDHEQPMSLDDLRESLELLTKACQSGSDDRVRETLRSIVPTFKKPEEVNSSV